MRWDHVKSYEGWEGAGGKLSSGSRNSKDRDHAVGTSLVHCSNRQRIICRALQSVQSAGL